MINACPRGFSLIFGRIQIATSKKAERALVFTGGKKLVQEGVVNTERVVPYFFFDIFFSKGSHVQRDGNHRQHGRQSGGVGGGRKEEIKKITHRHSLLPFTTADFSL